MRKFVLCTVLLLVGIPLLAGVSIGTIGGVELLIPEGDVESETYPAIGITANYSIHKIPISIRGGFEYGRKSKIAVIEGDEYDVTATLKTIHLAVQYDFEMSGLPVSFYVGAGPEIVMFDASEVLVEGRKYGANDDEFGALSYAGASVNMGAMSLFAEAGFGILFEEGNPNHVPIRGGIKINL
jgi:hypothetical protein